MGKGDKPKRQRDKKTPAPIEQKAKRAPIDSAARPNSHRLSRGQWAKPQGPMKSAQPYVDTASDAIGALHNAKLITGAEEQAARQFQKARRAYLQELPDIEGFKSCIAGGVPGYDDGDGDPDIIKAYRDLEERVGLKNRTLMLAVCEDGHVPKTLDALANLRSALRKIAGVDRAQKIVVNRE